MKTNQVEVSDEEFDEIQHEELADLLGKLLAEYKKNNSKDARIAELIKDSNSSLSIFLDKLKEVAAPVIAAPNITVNNDALAKIVTESSKVLGDKQDRVIELLEQLIVIRGADVDLIVKRDYGVIEKVVAKVVLPKRVIINN